MDDFDFDSAPVATQQPPTFENQGFGSNNDSFAQPDAPYDAQAEDVQQQQFASKFPALKFVSNLCVKIFNVLQGI